MVCVTKASIPNGPRISLRLVSRALRTDVARAACVDEVKDLRREASDLTEVVFLLI
ncbi:MAG: hypothetical protein ACI9IV_002293 [Paracoccaceae bacterium]|jgi:hypothetical protein|tara:strand:- start:37 stop:204 length:168 start_codon:yes stop_codon:yes gene_type:complete